MSEASKHHSSLLSPVPYWRLSSFYFFYFAFLGAWVPYWTLYLEQSLEFDAFEVSQLMGLFMLSRILGPYCWGALADFSSRRLFVIRLGAALSFLSFAWLIYLHSFVWFAFAIFLYSFFWNAILSQFEALTLQELGLRSSDYSNIRVWGSVGFIVLVAALGLWFECRPLDDLLFFLLALLLAIFLSTLWLSESSPKLELSGEVRLEQGRSLKPLSFLANYMGLRKAQREGGGVKASSIAAKFWRQIKQPSIAAMFVVFFLMQFSFGPYYTFFSIYLKALGYSPWLIGGLWSLAVFAEVLIFIKMAPILRRFSMKRLFVLTLVFTALRWLLTAYYAEQLWVLSLSQVLHALSFAAMHALSMEWLKRNFEADIQGQAQAFYSASSYGLGGVLGTLSSAYIWQLWQGGVFLMAAIACLLATLLMLPIKAQFFEGLPENV